MARIGARHFNSEEWMRGSNGGGGFSRNIKVALRHVNPAHLTHPRSYFQNENQLRFSSTK